MSAYNGRPLAGVMISVPALQKFVVTDSTGVFSLTGLPADRQMVRISYDGRDTREYGFALRNGRTTRLAVVLDVESLDLAPVIVEARLPDLWRDLAGFYERRRQYGGFARFYTREDIDHDQTLSLSSLLKGVGIFRWCLDGCMPTRFSHGHICSVPLSLDGLPIWAWDYDDLPIARVAGVEVYRPELVGGAFGLPVIGQFGFEGGDVVQGRGDCGSVGIWTR